MKERFEIREVGGMFDAWNLVLVEGAWMFKHAAKPFATRAEAEVQLKAWGQPC